MTLSAPPENWQDYWSEDEVLDGPDGTLYCLVEGRVIDELLQWAAQNEAVDAALTDETYGSDDRCAVYWTP